MLETFYIIVAIVLIVFLIYLTLTVQKFGRVADQA